MSRSRDIANSGDDVASGTVLTSSLMRCRCPDMQAGEVTVEASSNGEDFSIDGRLFRYIRGLVVVGLEPSKGPGTGGTEVTVRGAHEFGEQAKASNHNATNYQHQPNYVVANKKSSLPNQIELSVS